MAVKYRLARASWLCGKGSSSRIPHIGPARPRRSPSGFSRGKGRGDCSFRHRAPAPPPPLRGTRTKCL
ncbi:Hypothetical protein A7982_10321 [Minicystis rosea]|nr:Hypothetical protein A7982_10321 [Minicystis rosea]